MKMGTAPSFFNREQLGLADDGTTRGSKVRKEKSMNRNYSMATIQIVTILFATCVFFASCSDDWSMARYEESKRRGNRIIEALDQYMEDHSLYPDDLAILVPEYLDTIEPPVAGNKKWVYWINESKKIFNLGFEDDLESKPECWYSSDINDPGWMCDSK